MKTYFTILKFLQTIFLGVGIGILLFFPLVIVFLPEVLTENVSLVVYDIAHVSIFFVMLVRPLADIFINSKWIRPLVTLRKGVGVFSASIVSSFIFAKFMMDPVGYMSAFGTIEYWSLTDYALLGHLADISAIVLLVTSNKLSKSILGVWWKRIQKLSYVFFYGSALYVYLSFGHHSLLYAMIIITFVTVLAHVLNAQRRILALQAVKNNPQSV